MARRKKRKYTRRITRRTRRHYEDLDDEIVTMNPETKRRIVVIFLFAFGIISLLSLFDLAGPIGRVLALTLTSLFGWGDFLIPVIVLWFGYMVLRANRHLTHKRHYWGLILLVFSGYALLHWTQGREDLFSGIAFGSGGGYVGLVMSWPLMTVLGSVAGFIVLISVFFVSFLLLFDNVLEQFFGEQNIFRRGYMNIRHAMIAHQYNGDDESSYLESSGGSEEEDYSEDYEDDSDESDGDYGNEDEEQDTGVDIKQQKLIIPPRRRLPRINIPVELLSSRVGKPNAGDIKANQATIQKTLEVFGIHVDMGEVNVGPTVTQYTLRPAEGVKLTQITTLQNDLALALAAHPIRIEAPIPGKSLVGIEVPNKSVALVTLREIIDSSEFQKKRTSSLSLPFGKDVAGQSYMADLESMPHLLIAGATGSGKSIAINIMIISLMYQNQPEDLKFILVDPKRVELMSYKQIPYLLTPVVTDVKKTVHSLRWAVAEMDRRYDILSRSGHRQLSSYNMAAGSNQKLPFIVIIIDELADLMAVAAADVEAAIVRLAQMARAVGIHLIVATQRPSVDVITGLIKANITSRVAFSVASIVDSRTILDTAGAEKLLGRGDMLFISAELSKPKRLQGAYVSDKDIESVTSYLRLKAKPDYEEAVGQPVTGDGGGVFGDSGDSDELINDAKEVILQAGKASASLLQRRLRVGYARAARMLDILEESGFIGPAEGSKPREILYNPEDNDNTDHGYGTTNTEEVVYYDDTVDDEEETSDYDEEEEPSHDEEEKVK